MDAADRRQAGFGLYVHWPFCQAKCPYCDFNSHVVAEIDESRWIRAYRGEIERLAAETGPRVLNTIFFGGGTPSLMSAQLVGEVISAARGMWQPANDLEITLEANPTSVEAARFRDYRIEGVNRVSIGVQALRDEDLRALGRLHSVAEAKAAVATAQAVFGRVSFDLIYARQHQGLSEWRQELGEALEMASGHLSLYQLTIEDGTAFGERFRKGRLRGLPDEDRGADLFALTQEMCGVAGLPAYEISNHAAPGLECRHNLIYWNSGDYAGIGPGAHGRLTIDGARFATETPHAPFEWLRQVETTGSGELPRTAIGAEDQAAEALMMGLRTEWGVDPAFLRSIDTNKINWLVQDGLLEYGLDALRVTPAGRPLLNRILADLLA